MTLEQFLELQNDFVWAFGWLARWWLIMFGVGGTALAVFLFVLSLISSWLDNR
ncbi:MAG: hypothetical protein HY865_01065 [Chloroflexi bacterium]|nr:hypothetical protein [Chloroflexota bacterium]